MGLKFSVHVEQIVRHVAALHVRVVLFTFLGIKFLFSVLLFQNISIIIVFARVYISDQMLKGNVFLIYYNKLSVLQTCLELNRVAAFSDSVLLHNRQFCTRHLTVHGFTSTCSRLQLVVQQWLHASQVQCQYCRCARRLYIVWRHVLQVIHCLQQTTKTALRVSAIQVLIWTLIPLMYNLLY